MKPAIDDYLKSIALELRALKSRVQSFIGAKHWQSVGELNEAVLRAVLKRHMPKSIHVGKGFVIASAGPSPQIDILIYGSESPLLYQDGDFVIVPSDAVRGAIEVKTSASKRTLASDLRKLAEARRIICEGALRQPFLGFFAFDANGVEARQAAEVLATVAEGDQRRVIPCASLGDSEFVRYYEFPPEDRFNPIYAWRSYSIPDLAAACFLRDVIEEVREHPDLLGGSTPFPMPKIEDFKTGDVNLVPKKTNGLGSLPTKLRSSRPSAL